ncbi:MAG: histidine kinase [Proteobacteria bacterium]|nr:histidine kinase [Pseudomonadota bacterium]
MSVAVVFTLFGFALSSHEGDDWRHWGLWFDWYLATLIVSLTIGYLIRYSFALAGRMAGAPAMRRSSGWQRGALVAACVVAGIEIGCPLASWVTGLHMVPWWAVSNADELVAGSLLSTLVGFACYQFFAIKQRQIEAERAAAVARLALLQAQIEPHFLFNTLANVAGLMEADTPRAKQMLESFVDYLRASLGGLRRERHTLGDELDLVEAYLRVLQVRMEDRLAYRIDVPDALRAQRLPPLVLQPLVENAIQHGLEPKIDGGRLTLRAARDGASLVLQVEDDGLGLEPAQAAASRGTGTALANIRERLAELYGSAAALTIEGIAPHGVRARLAMPIGDDARP